MSEGQLYGMEVSFTFGLIYRLSYRAFTISFRLEEFASNVNHMFCGFNISYIILVWQGSNTEHITFIEYRQVSCQKIKYPKTNWKSLFRQKCEVRNVEIK